MPRLGHASFAVPLRSAPGFSYAHLCVSCHSISVTLHPLLLSSLPSLTKSVLLYSSPCPCTALHVHSFAVPLRVRLAIQQHVLSMLCRNHAHLSVLCHHISVRFYASSQPFGSSAQLRCPYFSLARHSISFPSLIYCSHHLSATFLLISFASLLPTSQVFAVTLHTLRIHCGAMRCQRNSLRSNSDAIPG